MLMANRTQQCCKPATCRPSESLRDAYLCTITAKWVSLLHYTLQTAVLIRPRVSPVDLSTESINSHKIMQNNNQPARSSLTADDFTGLHQKGCMKRTRVFYRHGIIDSATPRPGCLEFVGSSIELHFRPRLSGTRRPYFDEKGLRPGYVPSST